MKKNAEITTTQLVTIIVLIVSFAVILFFIFRLNLGETTDREICHNSVITRGSSVLPAESIPLKCQRSYLCLTEDGSCETLTKPLKEKVKTKEEVYGVLAEELTDCWFMFGEGKVNYVGTDIIEKLYCSICTQVAFDDSVKEEVREIVDKEGLYIYMGENNIPGKDETYLSYLYGTNDLQAIKTELNNQGVNFGSIDLDKQYYVMMGITSEVNKLGWVLGGAGVAALIAFAPVVGAGTIISGSIYIATGAGAGLVGITVHGLSGNEYLSPSIIEVNSQEFKDLDCASITTLA